MNPKILKLIVIMCLASLDGIVPVAALSGLFIPSNAPMLAFAFIAGPGAITSAALLEGSMKERVLAAILAGVIATILIVLSASLGPRMLEFVNIKFIRAFGALAVASIALLIIGIKIPQSTPVVLVCIGIIGGLIVK